MEKLKVYEFLDEFDHDPCGCVLQYVLVGSEQLKFRTVQYTSLCTVHADNIKKLGLRIRNLAEE